MSLCVHEQNFETLLKLNTLGEFLFSGTAVGENGHLFGGYTLAFALEAASATVNPQMWPQSIHANFIDSGKSGHELRMHVDVLRDTRAFAMRQVTVKMGDLTPLLMQASFHTGEEGPDWAPDVVFDYQDPESLVTDETYLPFMNPIDVRPINGPSLRGPGHRVPQVHPFWVRPYVELPDNHMLHAAVVAFISDYMVVGAAQAPGRDIPDGSLVVTMEHALWFHRPVNANDWLLFTAEPLSSYHGRGVSHGKVYNREGLLVASYVQEVLTRAPRVKA